MKKMQKIEEVWNIVYYFLYVGLNKFSRFIKAPLDCLIELPPIENLLIRRGGSVDMVREASKDTTENIVLGTSVFYASVILEMLFWGGLFGLDWIIAVLFFSSQILRREQMLIVLFFVALGINLILSLGLHYYLTDYRMKYHRYFKQFRKKPRAWKRKWAWISLGILFIPILTIVLSIVLQNTIIK